MSESEEPFPDEAPKWEQRMIYVIFASTFIFWILAYLTWQLIKSIKLGIIRKRMHSFLLFYLFIEFSFVLRYFYCFSGKYVIQLPQVAYGILCCFPPICTTTASLIFLILMLNSLDRVAFTQNIVKYGKRRIFVIIFIILFWAICIGLFAAIFSEKGDSRFWSAFYAYFVAGSNIIVCILIVITTIFYTSELKKFIHTFKEKKRATYIMQGATIMQLIFRFIQAIIMSTSIHIKWRENISFQIYACVYIFLSDILPAIGYIMFLHKESLADAAAEKENSKSLPAEANNTSIAVLVEKLYQKRDAKRQKDSIIYGQESLISKGFSTN